MKEKSAQVDSCFVKGGFTNWRKATEKFKEQEKSKIYNEALQKLCKNACFSDAAC